jgi:FkbM family methyltransferase
MTPETHEPIALDIESLPLRDDEKWRIRMSLGCRDCDGIAKMPHAGQTFDGPRGRYQLMHNGVRVIEDGYCGRWMTELIRLLRGHHEPQEEKAFHAVLRHLPPGSTMVELGSYWAYYSLWFQQAIPQASVHMIEPDPVNLELGRRNFAINGAVGHFYNYRIDRQSSPPARFFCERDRTERRIPSVSVDDFMAIAGLDRIDLLLADIQGAELAMLEGAARSLQSGKIRFLFVSTHHSMISHDEEIHRKCLDYLTACNAHVMAEHKVEESFSGDGLIVASCWPTDRCLPTVEVSRNAPTQSLFAEIERQSRTVRGTLRRWRQHAKAELRGLFGRLAAHGFFAFRRQE